MTPRPPALTPGRVLYQLYHRPLGALRRCLAQGGPVETWRTFRGENAMRAAAASLPPVPSSASHPVREVHLLTGRRYWHQTAFCLWTLARHSPVHLAPVLHDDGSLAPSHLAHLLRLFPSARLQAHAESLDRLHSLLPAARYPHLHERWQNYPHLRKLISPHLGSFGPKLVLDSDLLFFRRPDFLLDWLASPLLPLHAVDIQTSYGYPSATLDTLAGCPLAPRVNVGLAGLHSETIDWSRLEHCTATLLARHGTHYLLEQALFALLVAGRPCAIAPAHDYVTCPRLPEALAPQAVMHHFVADSKRWYFQRDWPRLSRPL